RLALLHGGPRRFLRERRGGQGLDVGGGRFRLPVGRHRGRHRERFLAVGTTGFLAAQVFLDLQRFLAVRTVELDAHEKWSVVRCPLSVVRVVLATDDGRRTTDYFTSCSLTRPPSTPAGVARPLGCSRSQRLTSSSRASTI